MYLKAWRLNLLGVHCSDGRAAEGKAIPKNERIREAGPDRKELRRGALSSPAGCAAV